MKSSPILLLWFFAILFLTNKIQAQEIGPVSKIPVPRHRFTVIAHRGDHISFPENTLEAFGEGIKNGVDYVEIDLRTTRDSQLVIMHDQSVDRMTDGKGRVRDLSLAQIQRLSVINKQGDSSKKYKVPQFEEVLKLCKDHIYIYLDYKDADVAQAYSMIKRFGMESQIIVYINSISQYRDWTRLAPKMPLMISLPGFIKDPTALRSYLQKNPITLLDGDYSDYTPELLKVATQSGLTVWPDIQSPQEANNWDKALELGFKGLQTDHPEDLIRYLENKGLR